MAAKEKLEVGTRIFYTGDMANPEGHGTITAIFEGTFEQGPTVVRISMDDGRMIRISATSFAPEYLGHCGTRFVTAAAYERWTKKVWQGVQEAAAAHRAKTCGM